MTALAPALATRYDVLNTALFLPSGGSRPLRRKLVDVLEVRAGQRAIDLGCGTGQVADHLLAAGADVVAVDVRPEMLAGARRRAPDATFIEGDFLEINLGRGYDRAVLSFVLHNFDAADRAQILRRVAAALGPHGRIGVLDWALPSGRRRAAVWRRVLTLLEPSPNVTDILDGALPADIAAAGLHIDHHQAAASGRTQILVLTRR
jgi:ubiquinone/menaquinone biosynthesis C-methylase UbiE